MGVAPFGAIQKVHTKNAAIFFANEKMGLIFYTTIQKTHTKMTGENGQRTIINRIGVYGKECRAMVWPWRPSFSLWARLFRLLAIQGALASQSHANLAYKYVLSHMRS